MSNNATRRASREGSRAIQGRLKPKDLPPKGQSTNRRQRRAAAKLKLAPTDGSTGQGKVTPEEETQ